MEEKKDVEKDVEEVDGGSEGDRETYLFTLSQEADHLN